jgi:glycosyltransferase involved in cell wall biosynthesis
MLDQRNLLCISNPTWEGDYAKTIVELMTVAAEKHKVLYVDYQFTIKDLLFAFLGKSNAPWKRMLGIESRLRRMELSEHHDVYVLTPPTILTINFLKDGWLYRRLLKLNSDIVARSIARALNKLKMNRDLILIDAFSPGMGLYNIGRFNETAHLYHCYDEIGAADWFGVHGADLERAYMPKVDGVICTSRGLYNTKKAYNKNTFLVQNGVNFDLFNQGFKDNISEEQKIIGYIGTIDDRMDYELLEKLFAEYPDWAFHFIGRCNYDKGKQILSEFPNVKLLGSMPVTSLPEALAAFHAGLIPFVKNDFTQGIYPLKINEYLAAGIPVILTRFSDLSEFENIASICDSPEAFSSALKKEVEEDTIQRRQERVAIAQRNSWSGRWEEIERIIGEVEAQKAPA